ncbi:MAG: hypothetical protein IJD13_07670, partial [Oscillospiraceae bacterium]|nr:hypothetical protein [Oscillospiraceae bacterium]
GGTAELCFITLRPVLRDGVFFWLTRVESVTVSLAAFPRLACVHFCKALALLQISRFALQKRRQRETLRPAKQIIFWWGEAEERSNTGVLQVMRKEKTKNYYLSGVTGSTLVSQIRN